MSGVKEKTTYIACDGKEFKTQDEAQRYETLKHADEELEKAVALYNVQLSQALKTADGEPFRLGREYYVVQEGLHDEHVYQEYLHGRNSRVVYYQEGREPAIVFSEYRGGDTKLREIRLTEVYAKRRPADLRVLSIKKKRLGWLQDDIAKLEKGLGIGGENVSSQI